METTFDFRIADAALQERIRAEVAQLCPGRTEIEFAQQVKVRSDATLDRRRIEETIERLRYIYKSVAKDLLYESSHSSLCQEDPLPYLMGSRQIVELSEGQWLIQGELLELMELLDALVVKLASQMSASEQAYPSFVPVDLLKRINYFKDFPHHIMVVTPLNDKQEALESFTVRHDFAKHSFETLFTDGMLQAVSLVAAPSVCYPCYYAFRNERLPDNRIFTARNRCSRNEPKGFRALTRLRNFTMREIMFLGDQDFVLAYRQKMLDALRDLVQSLGIACKIQSATDPFFTNDAAYKAVFQHTFKLKYECLAFLPFSKELLAIGSVNLHNDAFGKAFGVTLGDGTAMQSACLAFGLERWAYAVLCQYGWNRSKWPDSLRRRLS